MKYERLTDKKWKEIEKHCYAKGLHFSNQFTEEQTDEMIKRLAELEDKIESGELVELPQLGDTACRFYRKSTGEIFAIEDRVIKIEINRKGTLIYFTNLPNFYLNKNHIGDLSKNYIDLECWYFTKKSQAEAKLKELQGE